MAAEKQRLKMLVDRFNKAEAFFASPAPPSEKAKWQGKLDALVDELAKEYERLRKQGKASPADLPAANYDNAKMVLRGREVKYSEKGE